MPLREVRGGYCAECLKRAVWVAFPFVKSDRRSTPRRFFTLGDSVKKSKIPVSHWVWLGVSCLVIFAPILPLISFATERMTEASDASVLVGVASLVGGACWVVGGLVYIGKGLNKCAG